ncbi:uncharacterized protein TNCV_1573001 [Trichonephila clavipes]|uniref:Uncharacterized protein n=1 Tax=Trichonephila clavipes TaxID=2585209 RepID=A0A8X6VPC0_TRICX|nr:uncharacterized protein TNCV_1573001 [Trichonephila clavipes]
MTKASALKKEYNAYAAPQQQESDVAVHKNEVLANGTSEQTHMGKKYLLTIEIPDYRPSIENVELSSPVQHNASPDKNSRTTVMVSFLDVTGIKPCPDLSPNQNALRISFGT